MASPSETGPGPGLNLQLLGGFHLFDARGVELGPFGRSAVALISYLALEGSRPHPRDQLATLLWPDRPDEQARHSLRQTLLVSRRVLDGAVGKDTIIERDGLLLDRDVVTCDVVCFEAALARGDPDSVREALKLYQGPLLDGFDVRSSLFEDWLIPERARLHDKAMSAFEQAVAARLAAGASESAVALAERGLALDPAHEALHRALISAHIALGDRDAALDQFERCRNVMHRLLDAEPEPETLAIKRQAEAMLSPTKEAVERTLPALSLGMVPNNPSRSAGIAPPQSTSPRDIQPIAEPTPPTQVASEPGPAAPAKLGQPTPRSAVQWAAALRLQRWRRRLGRGVIALGCLAIAAGFLLWQAPWQSDGAAIVVDPPPTDRPTLAVLTLRTVGDAEGLSALADGITEGVNAGLLVISRVFVISRVSILALGADGTDPVAVAHRLQVRYLLDGQIQQDGDELRVTVHLTDTQTGGYKMGGVYSSRRGEAFKVQDQIVKEIITRIQVDLTEGEQERLRAKQAPRSLEAWLRVGEALQALRQLSQAGNLKARRLYEEARAFDSRDAGAHEGLAWTHYLDARFHWSADPAESLKMAAELANIAIELDPGWGRAYALLGQIQLFNNDLAGAIAQGQKAIELSPNDSEAIALLANTLTYAGEIQLAESRMHEAMQLCPYYPDWYAWNLGRVLRLKGSYDDAIAALKSRLSEAPGSIAPRVELALAQFAAGETEAARETGESIKQAFPTFSTAAWYAQPRHRDPGVSARESDILRKIGLPD